MRGRIDGDLPLITGWGFVAFILVVGPMNPSMELVYDPRVDSLVLQFLEPIDWLPSALVAERSFLYGGLFLGVLVQALALWHLIQSRRRIRRILAFLVGNAIIAALAGMIFRFSASPKILGLANPVHPEFFGPFRYHNHWTAYALLSLGAAVALAGYYWFSGERAKEGRFQGLHLGWSAFAVIILASLPMSGARAGVLFAVLALPAFAFVSWREVLRNLRPRTQAGKSASTGWTRWRVALLTCLLLGLSGATFVWFFRGNIERAYEETRQAFDTAGPEGILTIDTPRFKGAWTTTGEMISRQPAFGWGYGSHLYAFYLVAGKEWRNPTGEVFARKEFAHNDWLQMMAEIGIIGFGGLILPPFLLWRRIRKESAPDIVTSCLLVGSGLVLMLATFEFPLSNPAVLVIFFVQTTLALKHQSLKPKPTP